MRFEVVVNGGAGSVDEADDSSEVAAIEEAFEAAGASAHAQVAAPEDFQDVIQRIWSGEDGDRPDAVVIAGGDGTVACAAQVALEHDVVLAVLPMGTFNHFAKDLAMPTELTEAAAAIVGGEIRHVDVAEVNDRTFVNNAALGLYPTLVAIREQITDRRGWGKVRAVPVASGRALRSFPLHRLDLRGEGFGRQHVRTPLVFIGNGIYDNASGGVHRRAGLTDGCLGVSVAHVVSRFGLIRLILRTLLAGSSKARELDVSETPALTIDSRARRLRVGLDGEVTWLETPLRFRTRAGALAVLAPPVAVPAVGPEPVGHPVSSEEAITGEHSAVGAEGGSQR
ncbi:MAG: diacylglycerol/lipid kinase family protein [Acidimicrobiales bacterium]